MAVNYSGWVTFTSAPHRVMFLAGTVQAIVTIAWWLIDLLARYAGWYAPISWTVPSSWVHAYLMLYAFFPFFMFGFLMTAIPNWLEIEIRRAEYVSAFVLMMAGVAVFYAGLLAGRAILALGVVVQLAGWAVAVASLVRILVVSAPQPKVDPVILVSAMIVGWLGAAAFAAWLVGGNAWWAELSRRGGIWFVVLPVFLTVGTRMLPVFARRVAGTSVMGRPAWALPVLLAGSIGHGLLDLSGARTLLWVVDWPMAGIVLYLTVRWGLRRGLTVPLVAMLHLALLGLALALFLFGLQSLALLGGVPVLGLAPLHALTIGFFSAMVIGMASRVSLGHSGRPLVADPLTWYCFLGVLAAAMLRIAGELPGAASLNRALIPLAAAVWLGSFVLWARRYVPMYLRPNADDGPE
ncbi:MAG: NnrS family protein [Nitrospirota bacterium]